jgi:hypothetical protein
VTDLAAFRTGSQVSLTWTMPRKNTDKLLLKNNIAVRVCRREGVADCVVTGGDLQLAPGATGSFTETLPATLASGAPRTLAYFVELKNRKDRSAGLSNPAAVLAGQTPAPVTGLTAEPRKDGVILRWTAMSPSVREPARTFLRLQRKLLTPSAKSKAQPGLLEPPTEPVDRTLVVESPSAANAGSNPHGVLNPNLNPGLDRALDREIRLDQTYEYRAQRVAQVTADGQTLELAGELSAPVRVEVRDIFPPAVPTGLAAVASALDSGKVVSIDLSWQPVADANLAGYIVYRREADGAWQRVSPAQLLVGPAFHDAQVLPGHTYRYQVSAIDQAGHESPRSAETQETVPAP